MVVYIRTIVTLKAIVVLTAVFESLWAVLHNWDASRLAVVCGQLLGGIGAHVWHDVNMRNGNGSDSPNGNGGGGGETS